MIIIEPYKTKWPEEFQSFGRDIRHALGDLALRIDHIGSTSVPGLAAKDIIDIQITVNELEVELEKAMNRAGYQRLTQFNQDHIPPEGNPDPSEWMKWLFNPSASQRRMNVHVRLAGHANQRYPLLFRDYLRSHPMAAKAYGQVKSALAMYHPNNVDAYYDVKDPVCDIIVSGAEDWAATTNWIQGPTDC